jgi:uncharacterized membrane protein
LLIISVIRLSSFSFFTFTTYAYSEIVPHVLSITVLRLYSRRYILPTASAFLAFSLQRSRAYGGLNSIRVKAERFGFSQRLLR